jgi:hypothetical protein
MNSSTAKLRAGDVSTSSWWSFLDLLFTYGFVDPPLKNEYIDEKVSRTEDVEDVSWKKGQEMNDARCRSTVTVAKNLLDSLAVSLSPFHLRIHGSYCETNPGTEMLRTDVDWWERSGRQASQVGMFDQFPFQCFLYCCLPLLYLLAAASKLDDRPATCSASVTANTMSSFY